MLPRALSELPHDLDFSEKGLRSSVITEGVLDPFYCNFFSVLYAESLNDLSESPSAYFISNLISLDLEKFTCVLIS